MTSGSDVAAAEATQKAIGPLSAEAVAALVAARDRLAAVRRADLLATINGWSYAACAALTLAVGLAEWTLIPIGLGLVLVARAELAARTLLRIPDVRGLDRLVVNQGLLLLMVIAYCAWRVWVGMHEPPVSATPFLQPYLQRAPPDFGETLDRIQRLALFGIYGTLLALSLLYQGGCAVFYYAQRKSIARYAAETPDWVRELERVLGSGR